MLEGQALGRLVWHIVRGGRCRILCTILRSIDVGESEECPTIHILEAFAECVICKCGMG